LNDGGLDEAQGSDGDEARQTIAVYAYQLFYYTVTSTTDTCPPNNLIIMAMM
jgi:hypothetical protein